MTPTKRVIALVGTYRKGGVIDAAVDEVLAGAQAAGAVVTKVYLVDRQIAFCTNCRACTQEAGDARGACLIQDEMGSLLDEIEAHDALVLASPMNFFTVTAVTKRFIERLVCFSYWPWGAGAPKMRRTGKAKRAVLIVSLAAPSFLILPFNHITKILKSAATLLGAPKPRMLWIGLAALRPRTELSERIKRKARRLGKGLVA